MTIGKSPGERLFDGLNILFLCVVCFLTLYPFRYVMVLSLNDGRDSALSGVCFWPRRATLANYRHVLGQAALRTAYLNTILRTTTGAVVNLIVCGVAAYALSKRSLPARSVFLTFFVIPMLARKLPKHPSCSPKSGHSSRSRPTQSSNSAQDGLAPPTGFARWRQGRTAHSEIRPV